MGSQKRRVAAVVLALAAIALIGFGIAGYANLRSPALDRALRETNLDDNRGELINVYPSDFAHAALLPVALIVAGLGLGVVAHRLKPKPSS